MISKPQHVSVCVCTYKRPHLLTRLLRELGQQETGTLFTYSIVVADNDPLGSAERVVSDFAAASTIPVTYCAEPRQSICLARNKAIEHSTGDFIAFIDDDEFPAKSWLLRLFQTCDRDGVDGVLGPVNRHFDETPPKWVIKGKFYVRPSHPTGFVIDWREGRTGNVLLKRRLFHLGEPPFNPEFHRGGDTDFFRRMILLGHVFIWCDEAVVYEVVPPIRWTRTFMLKRALLRGAISLKDRPSLLLSITKSVLAVPAYTLALPFTLVLGHHRSMDLLVRLFQHLGKLLAFVGIKPVKSLYVTD
jgi:glycosyltransferase involved in cell wall biosynthesis